MSFQKFEKIFIFSFSYCFRSFPKMVLILKNPENRVEKNEHKKKKQGILAFCKNIPIKINSVFRFYFYNQAPRKSRSSVTYKISREHFVIEGTNTFFYNKKYVASKVIRSKMKIKNS